MDERDADNSLAGIIDERIKSFIVELKDKKTKLTLADIARLLELRKQLASEELREVKVTWVEYKPATPAISE